MKLILSLFVVLSGLTAFAGPEDHIAAQVCYQLQNAKNAPKDIPQEVCLETLNVYPQDNTINIYSYFYPNLFKDMTLSSLIRNTEDTYKFKAESVLRNEWQSGCGDGNKITLFIDGQTDFNGDGQNELGNLKIRIEQDQTNDTCHSEPQTTVYKYVNPYNPQIEMTQTTTFTIEKNQRFAAGWYDVDTQNMFTSYPYSKNWNGKISCGVNVQAPQATVDKLFTKAHDFQFYFTAKKSQSLKKTNFKSQATPYSYESCVEYSNDTNPEDVTCVRTETVYGTNSSFEFEFKNKELNAKIACSEGSEVALTEAQALEIVQQMLDINVK
ncbi:MAG: hypothetical protein ABL930_10270 [Pseudobdellovibrio sp.]